MMDIFQILTDDIEKMHQKPMDVWLANTAERPMGRKVRIQPILAFLKGDTPQRAIFTSTSGHRAFASVMVVTAALQISLI
jgi:hypothetical protein